MAHSVELLLDEHGEAEIRRLWHGLAAAGLPSQLRVQSETNRPHITVVAARRIGADVDDVLAELAPRLPVPCVVGAPLVFGGARLTLARLIVASAGLVALHTEIYRRCLPFAGEPYPHSAPGRWTPHATLGRRFTPAEVGEALARVDGIGDDIEASVVGLRRWDGDARVERVLIS